MNRKNALSRRSLLKKGGASLTVGAALVGATGTASAATYWTGEGEYGETVVYLYPSYNHDTEAENIADYVGDFLSDILSYGGIDGYDVYIRYDGHEEYEGWNSLGDFDDWRQGKGFTERADHHGIAEDDADSGSGGAAYGGPVWGSAGSDGTASITFYDGTIQEARNTANQEISHNFLYNDAIDDSLMGSSGQHSLGTVLSDGSITPMATGYDSTGAREGECSTSNAWLGTYNHNPTICTKKAWEDTHQYFNP